MPHDAQAMLLQAWVRTGFFADAQALQHLDVSVVPSTQVRMMCALGRQVSMCPCTDAVHPSPPATRPSPLMVTGLQCWLQGQDAGAGAGELTLVSPVTPAAAGAVAGGAEEPARRNGTLHSPAEGPSTSGDDAAAHEHILLSLRLKHGKVRGTASRLQTRCRMLHISCMPGGGLVCC